MKMYLFLLLIIPCISNAQGTDYWSKDKDINWSPGNLAGTTCASYNKIDQASDDAKIFNEFMRAWMEGWVSAFAVYSDWSLRNIEKEEYVNFIIMYCNKFPQYTFARAAHTFTYRVKK